MPRRRTDTLLNSASAELEGGHPLAHSVIVSFDDGGTSISDWYARQDSNLRPTV